MKRDRYNELSSLALKAGLTKEDFDGLLKEEGISVDPDNGPAEWAAQNPLTAKISAAGDLSNRFIGEPLAKLFQKGSEALYAERDGLSTADIFRGSRLGEAVGGAAKVGQIAQEFGAKKPRELAEKAEAAGLPFGREVANVARAQEAVGEMTIPQTEIDVMMELLSMGEARTAPKAPFSGRVRPGVQKALGKIGAGDAFTELADYEAKVAAAKENMRAARAAQGSIEASTMDLASEKNVLLEKLDDLDAKAAVAKEKIFNHPYASESLAGQEIQSSILGRKAKARSTIAQYKKAKIDAIAEQIYDQPTELIESAKEILESDLANDLKLNEDAALNRVIRKAVGLEKEVVKGQIGFVMSELADALTERLPGRRAGDAPRPDIPIEIIELKSSQATNVKLKDLLDADSELGQMIQAQRKPTGDYTPKGAKLLQIQKGLRASIDRIAGAHAIKNTNLAARIAKVRERWRGFFEVYDNPDMQRILAADDPEKVFNSLRGSDLAWERLQKAAGPVTFARAKSKFLNELRLKIETSPSPIDVFNNELKDPAGKNRFESLLSPSERAGILQYARIKDTKPQVVKMLSDVENQILKSAESSRARRVGDDPLERVLRRKKDVPPSAIKKPDLSYNWLRDFAKRHYGGLSARAALAGTAMLVSPQPARMAIAAATTLSMAPEAFAQAYVKNIKFRKAVNSNLDYLVSEPVRQEARTMAAIAAQEGTDNPKASGGIQRPELGALYPLGIPSEQRKPQPIEQIENLEVPSDSDSDDEQYIWPFGE